MLKTATIGGCGYTTQLRGAIDDLEIALPSPGDELDQDEEWVVVKHHGEWKKIRLHNYGHVYAIQGLYEKWVYEALQCRSPQQIRRQLAACLKRDHINPATLTVLDLGAGNGYVAEELGTIGIKRFVGLDIVPEAATSAERDRPGLYNDYIIGDITDLAPAASRLLDKYEFNCMTCVAALGFGDIPPEAFAATYNRVEDGGWIAFTIKSDFLDEADQSGFSVLIRTMLANNVLSLDSRKQYTHRISTDGEPLEYTAFIGSKQSGIPATWLT